MNRRVPAAVRVLGPAALVVVALAGCGPHHGNGVSASGGSTGSGSSTQVQHRHAAEALLRACATQQAQRLLGSTGAVDLVTNPQAVLVKLQAADATPASRKANEQQVLACVQDSKADPQVSAEATKLVNEMPAGEKALIGLGNPKDLPTEAQLKTTVSDTRTAVISAVKAIPVTTAATAAWKAEHDNDNGPMLVLIQGVITRVEKQVPQAADLAGLFLPQKYATLLTSPTGVQQIAGGAGLGG